MKFKKFAVLAAFFMIFAGTFSASAQDITSDVVFLKGGWIPNYTVAFDEEGAEDIEAGGFAVQGEYNLNLQGFWLGIGFEYQRVVDAGENGADDLVMQYIQPMVSGKITAVGGLYLGAGLSGKYLISIKPDGEPYTTPKKIDLWANGILGYHMPVAEGVYLLLEGRFGWNLTNKQFSEYEVGDETYDVKTKSAYDMAFYVGIGTHALQTGY
ncbi:MAG: hypothetical protein MUC95_04355 [Spirochaetes bacterium]|jgi:hypothetical protein|nr:hypothetical protein [Spirochaetota bacterium]